MDTFIQPKITGYRQLTQEEVTLMNEGKELAEKVGAFVEKLRTYVPTRSDGGPTFAPGGTLDQRWISIGSTHLQQGFMCVTRGIAQPTTY